MNHLVPCSGCRRHVRASEDACPFCASTLPRQLAKPTLPTSRLARAQLFAFGVTLASACGGNEPPPPEPDPQETIMQPYGAPPQPDPEPHPEPAPDDPTSMNQMYGAPPRAQDEDEDEEARPEERVQAPAAAYGAPPMENGPSVAPQPPPRQP